MDFRCNTHRSCDWFETKSEKKEQQLLSHLHLLNKASEKHREPKKNIAKAKCTIDNRAIHIDGFANRTKHRKRQRAGENEQDMSIATTLPPLPLSLSLQPEC